jgi:ribosomal protein S18 acetylase RimI-like enzyme
VKRETPNVKRQTSAVYRVSPPVSGEALNGLFAASWAGHRARDFGPVLRQSLAYVCAYVGDVLIGYVNLAWDGGVHAFVLDTTVHPAYRRRGIGTELVRRAAEVGQERGVRWLHVDYVPELEAFYRGCGFRQTAAGLMDLSS